MARKPEITFYFLQGSRAIRIAWLLEELSLEYTLVSAPRAPSGLAPDDFKSKIGTAVGKSPTIKDHGLVIQESAAIAEYVNGTLEPSCFYGSIYLPDNNNRYLLETYGADSFLLPPTSQPAARAKAREWMSAAEGTFMIHALAILYARWRIPEAAKSSLPDMEKGLAVNVQKDLDWLEEELKSGNGEFLVGDELTVADVMMHFSVQFIFARKLGTGEKSWPGVERWMEGLEGLEGYRKAVKRTGYKL